MNRTLSPSGWLCTHWALEAFLKYHAASGEADRREMEVKRRINRGRAYEAGPGLAHASLLRAAGAAQEGRGDTVFRATSAGGGSVSRRLFSCQERMSRAPCALPPYVLPPCVESVAPVVPAVPPSRRRFRQLLPLTSTRD